jgi:hypothetical protein
MNINASTRLFDLLAEYPKLEEKIVGIAPPFAKLKTPVLRRTVGKLATLEKVAMMGDLDVNQFLNTLRREVGQPELGSETKIEIEPRDGDPEWIKGQPVEIVDGSEMLNRGVHPLNHINEVMQSLGSGQFILLKTNFRPLPLFEAMEKQNYAVHSVADAQDPGQHYTYIGKK